MFLLLLLPLLEDVGHNLHVSVECDGTFRGLIFGQLHRHVIVDG